MSTIPLARARAPWYFTVIAWIFLLYSALAAFDDVMGMLMREEYFKASGMTPSQVTYFSTLPMLVRLASSVSVWAGLLGAAALLARRRIAATLFAVSAAGTVTFIVYTWFLSEGISAMGALWFMPAVIGVMTAALAVYAVRLTRAGFLR